MDRQTDGQTYWTEELSSLFMTQLLNVMHAPMKFHEYIPYGLGLMART